MIHSYTASFMAASFAIAFVLPGAAHAMDANDAVSTRTDSATEQHNGRDSVYALPSTPVYSSAQAEPQRFGRAGGYVGTDKVEMMKLRSQAPVTAHSADMQPAKGDRFDTPDSAHGQVETGAQTR